MTFKTGKGKTGITWTWMKPLVYVIAIALCALWATNASGETGLFDGEGWGKIEGPDTNPARRKALKKALRQAVEDGAGSLLPQKVFIDNYEDIEKSIIKNVKKYIETYTVIAEAREEDRYRVSVKAKIKLDILRADLVAMGLLLPRDKIPKWLIVTPDRVADGRWRSQWISGGGGISTCEAALADMIRDYGFRVAVAGPGGSQLSGEGMAVLIDFIQGSTNIESNPIPPAALKFAESNGADFILLGRGLVKQGEGLSGSNYALGTADLKLVAVDVSKSEILIRISRRAAVETVGAKGLDGRVLRMAVRRTKKELFTALDGVNPAGSAAGFPIIEITFKGVNTYEQYRAIDKALDKDIQGVRSIKVLKLAPGELVLEVKYAGKPESLISLLEKYPFDFFGLEREGSGEDDSYTLIVE